MNHILLFYRGLVPIDFANSSGWVKLHHKIVTVPEKQNWII